MTLTQSEIASMRAEIPNTILDMLCTISRYINTGTDPAGQPVNVWGEFAANVPCHWWREINVEITGGINVEVARDRIIFQNDADITELDRITYLTDIDGHQVVKVTDAPLELIEVISQTNQVTCSARRIK